MCNRVQGNHFKAENRISIFRQKVVSWNLFSCEMYTTGSRKISAMKIFPAAMLFAAICFLYIHNNANQ